MHASSIVKIGIKQSSSVFEMWIKQSSLTVQRSIYSLKSTFSSISIRYHHTWSGTRTELECDRTGHSFHCRNISNCLSTGSWYDENGQLLCFVPELKSEMQKMRCSCNKRLFLNDFSNNHPSVSFRPHIIDTGDPWELYTTLMSG